MMPIQNEPNLLRDEKTNVIINSNVAEYEIILQKRRHKEELAKVTEEVEDLKKMVGELAKLVKASK